MVKKKWEHKVILNYGINDERTIGWEKDLNYWGAEGWELVSVIVRPEVPAYEASESDKRVARTVVFLKREQTE